MMIVGSFRMDAARMEVPQNSASRCPLTGVVFAIPSESYKLFYNNRASETLEDAVDHVTEIEEFDENAKALQNHIQ